MNRQTKVETYGVNIPDELKQQRDGLPSSDPHVDVIVLQQTRKFRQMSETEQLHNV